MKKSTRTALNNLNKQLIWRWKFIRIAIIAARHRATLGEISMAMEKSFGRYTANIQSVSGVYSGAMKDQKELELKFGHYPIALQTWMAAGHAY
jgi:hypothetical protein